MISVAGSSCDGARFSSDNEAKEFHGLLNSLVLKMADGGVKYDLEVLSEGKSKPTAMEGCKCHDALK